MSDGLLAEFDPNFPFPAWLVYLFFVLLFWPFYVPALLTLRFLIKFRQSSQPDRKKQLVTLAYWWGSALVISVIWWKFVTRW